MSGDTKPAPRLAAPSVVEWLLATAGLVLGLLGFLASSHGQLVVCTHLQGGIAAVLLAVSARQAQRSRAPGKFLLIASTFAYFWWDAAQMANQEPPFLISRVLPIYQQQFGVGLIRQGLFYVALFQVLALIGYSIRPGAAGLFRRIQERMDARHPAALGLRYLLAACAVVPLFMEGGFSLGKVVQFLLGAGRDLSGPQMGNIGLLKYLELFGMFGAALVLAEVTVFRSLGRLWKIFLAAVIVAPFLMQGVRHNLLFVALPAVILGFARFRGRLTFFRGVQLLLLGSLLMGALQLQFIIRRIGWTRIGEVRSEQLLGITPTGQFGALLVAEHLVPARYPYFHELAEPYFIIHWIPRAWWPEKPIMKSWATYNAFYTVGSKMFNVTPSILGQFHINWGLAGVVFIGLWIGFLTALADRALLVTDVLRQQCMGVFLGLFYGFVVSAFRFYSPVYFAPVLFGFLAMAVLTRRQRAPVGESPMPERSPVPAGA